MQRPILAIPGPVEVSPAVLAAHAAPPHSHQDPELIEAFGCALELMRTVWSAPPDAQPFVVAGSGTLAMDSCVANLIEPGDRVLVAVTGYFSRRFAEMIRRAGGEAIEVAAEAGDAPFPDQLISSLDQALGLGPLRAVALTHVDTSSGVRLDLESVLRAARERGVLGLVDGVCATGGEHFEMESWGADVYLTASQKALSLPPGLALLVASRDALAVRAGRRAAAPPMMLDWEQWRPVMEAYEARRPSYFATPPTPLIAGLRVGLEEIMAAGVGPTIERHRTVAAAMRAAWSALGLRSVPVRPELEADTLSCLWLPEGIGDEVRAHIAQRGAIVAGGLLPELRGRTIRVGHMGWTTSQPALLRRIAGAVGEGLRDAGAGADLEAALSAFDAEFGIACEVDQATD